jgi:hypothetical protein
MKTYIYARTNIFDSLADMALSQGELQKAEGLYKVSTTPYTVISGPTATLLAGITIVISCILVSDNL